MSDGYDRSGRNPRRLEMLRTAFYVAEILEAVGGGTVREITNLYTQDIGPISARTIRRHLESFHELALAERIKYLHMENGAGTLGYRYEWRGPIYR
jgi:hypothetical protein